MQKLYLSSVYYGDACLGVRCPVRRPVRASSGQRHARVSRASAEGRKAPSTSRLHVCRSTGAACQGTCIDPSPRPQASAAHVPSSTLPVARSTSMPVMCRSRPAARATRPETTPRRPRAAAGRPRPAAGARRGGSERGLGRGRCTRPPVDAWACGPRHKQSKSNGAKWSQMEPNQPNQIKPKETNQTKSNKSNQIKKSNQRKQIKSNQKNQTKPKMLKRLEGWKTYIHYSSQENSPPLFP